MKISDILDLKTSFLQSNGNNLKQRITTLKRRGATEIEKSRSGIQLFIQTSFITPFRK